MRDLSDLSPAARPGPDVLFVFLPYGAVERPSIALGLLKQILVDAGHSAEVFYPNMDFAERVGIHAYDAISRLSRELVGEWTFSGAVFAEMDSRTDAYMLELGRILKPTVG